MKRHIPESILDDPRDSLCPEVWNLQSNPPSLNEEAQHKIDNLIKWAQSKYKFNNLSVYIIGSICSNSWTENSDIDIDFCSPGMVEDDNDEDAVKEFGYNFKRDFIENYQDEFTDESHIGSHPIEVYFNPNPFQCFMSVGCYNVIEKKWEVGPEMKEQDFDPVSEYYADAMKQVDRILKDVRTEIFEVYELAFVNKKSNDQNFKDDTFKDIFKKLDNISELYKTMKRVRSNFQKPCKSREEALKRRKDRKQHVVDAAFKFLDKFGYLAIMKDMIQLYDTKNTGAKLSQSYIVSQILASVKENMSLKHLQDTEDENDKKFLRMIHEADLLEEGVGALVKLSFIASLMAISSFLPASALTKNLSHAKKQNSHLTVNSPDTKKAIAASAIDNQKIGPMSKTNVVNAVARCLWEEGRGKKEGTEGRKAIASVILNRTGNNPEHIIDVIKQPAAFSYTAGYNGGWTDSTYQWFLPYKAIAGNESNKAIWDECNQLALQLVNGNFKSTIGNYNAYMNKDTADKKNVESWGKQCQHKIGSHHFGYLRDRDPKYVVPGTYTSQKIAKNQKNRKDNFKKNAQANSKSKKAKIVVVKSGQTLSQIAKDYKTTVEKILELNDNIKDRDNIITGQKIRVA